MADNITRPSNVSDNQWVKAQQLYNTAKNRGDRYPELTVAQAALETGWFKSPAGKYNYFGQKASSSQQGSLKSTTEVSGGSSYRTKAKFRDYNTLDEAVDDRINKWGSKYRNANTVDEAISSIWRYNPKTKSGEGYATDTQYGQKLKSILGSMGVSTSDQGNVGGAYANSSQKYDMPNYGVDTSVNLATNTGDYTTAPEYQETTKNSEVQAAKEELLQKQNEKDFLAEMQAVQQQQDQQQGDPGIDQSYYQMPTIGLPDYQQIAAEQAQSQSQFQFEYGGEFNEEGLAYAQNGTTFFPQVNSPFTPGGYQSPFMQQPTKAAPVKTAPTNKPAPKVSRKPSKYEYLFETDDSKKIDTRDIAIPRFNGIKEGSGNTSQVILNQQQEQNKKVFKEEVKKQEELKSAKELNDFKKEVTSKAVLEDSIENDEVSLDINNYRTEKDVTNLQKMLTEKGYNLNPQGKFANNGIDGKLGNVTKNAMIRYNQHNSDSGYASIKEGTGFIGNCQEGQCSEYMQNEIFRNVQPKLKREEWNKKTGLYGNAWDIGGNIIKSGGSKIVPKAVKPGDVVTMFTGGNSSYQGEANAAGTGTTHTGLIDKVNPDGSYYILHNVHDKNRLTGEYEGREFRDLVKDGKIVSGGLARSFEVRGAFRPDYKEVQLGEKKILRNDLNLTIDPKKSNVLSSKEYDNNFTSENAKNKLEKTFIKPLNDTRNKTVMAKVFNLGDDEYQSLAKVTLGILGQETSFGTNAKYTTGTKQLGAGLAKLVGYKSDEVSKGAGRLKYETNFGADDLTELGINQDNFDDEDKAPLTTMYKLATDYKKFLNKGYNKKDAMYRAITVYNVSLNKVSQGKKIEDWAKSYDVDYTNKVLNYSSMFNVNDGKKSYKTATDELLLQPNVYKWREKLKKEKKL